MPQTATARYADFTRYAGFQKQLLADSFACAILLVAKARVRIVVSA